MTKESILILDEIEDLDTLNKTLQQVLISNGVLKEPKHIECNKVRTLPLKRSPSDNFRRKLDCKDHTSCPVCRNKIISRNKKKIFDLTNEFEGRYIMNTFNLSHDQRHDLPYLYNGLKKCIKGLKNSYGWRKLQKELNHQFHFDRIEITVSPDKGYHPHLHQIFCCLNWKISLEEIKNRLFDIWSRLLKRDGLRSVTKKNGVDTIDGIGIIQYVLEQEQYEKRLKEIIDIISESNKRTKKRFSKKRDGFEGYTIGDMEMGILYYEGIPNYHNEDFSKEELVKHLSEIQKTFEGDFYCRVNKS